jgi:hypothetical protein
VRRQKCVPHSDADPAAAIAVVQRADEPGGAGLEALEQTLEALQARVAK